MSFSGVVPRDLDGKDFLSGKCFWLINVLIAKHVKRVNHCGDHEAGTPLGILRDCKV